jgi:cytoskeleton protein RodZ
MARKPRKNESVESNDIGVDKNTISTGADAQTVDEYVLPVAEQKKPKTNCGGALNAAREAQGLSVQDVAKQLRLGVKQIEALEADDFAALPEATIVKGFIRNYAKLLKIPSEPLVAAYNEMKPEKAQHAYTLHPGINMKISESNKPDVGRYFILTFIILVLAAVWFFYQNYVQKPSPVSPIPEIVEALPELALPATERMQDGATFQIDMPEQGELYTASEPVNTDNTDTAVDAELTAKNDNELTANAESSLTTQPSTRTEANLIDESNQQAEVAPEPGKTRIAFAATQETWLSVVNASGDEVYNKILYAGNRDVVDVWQPAEIVVGNAHGATLVVDGKPIDLAPYTRINVARVRLDR